MSEVKLTKTQQALKQRIDRVKELYEKFYEQYKAIPNYQEWRVKKIDDRICALVQNEYVISYRKAVEYLKLAKTLKEQLTIPQTI